MSSTQVDKVLISDVLCERKVIGTILSISGVYVSVAEHLSPDCFYDERCNGIYNAIVEVYKRGDDIDVVSVIAELAKEGSNIEPTFVLELSSEAGYGSETVLERNALRLKELDTRRRLWRLGQRLINAGVSETDEVVDIQQQAMEGLNGLFGSTSGVFTLTDALNSLTKIMTRNMQQDVVTTGSRTGFRRIDAKGGFQPTDLIIIAGRTSQGKTALSLSILKNMAERGDGVAFYSMEMSKEQLAARMLAMKSGVSSSSILYNGDINPEELGMIDKAKGLLPGDNVYFDDDCTSNIDTILLSIRKLYMRYKIKGAIVDYLQILSVLSKSSSTREQQMGDACRRLKNLAKELKIWIIAISQLSRNSQDPVPTLGQLRDSGQIEEAADVVMFVYRPEMYNRSFPEPFNELTEEDVKGKAMIDVAKGRNIGIFKFIVDFDAPTTHFTDLRDDEGEYEQVPDEPVEDEMPF